MKLPVQAMRGGLKKEGINDKRKKEEEKKL